MRDQKLDKVKQEKDHWYKHNAGANFKKFRS